MRVGMGFDAHAFAEGRPLVLGGVTVPSDVGLVGHSDADVIVHALMDAILGAMRAGDIGKLFPDTDAAYKDASSIDLLRQVGEYMRSEGHELADADCVIALEAPRISPSRDQMRANMAEALGVDIDRIGLKATTTEGMGFTGRKEGAAAWAVVLLDRG